jgi:C4-dicarboxylate-specific signal transduction histidine kinase
LKEIREGVERIKSDVHRATQIINRLRALSQKSVHQKEPVDINPLVEETLLLLRRELARRGISLQLDLAPGLPQIVGDRIQLQQVFLNLVMNAIEAMVKVFDRPRELRIRSDKAGTDKVIVPCKT